MKEEIILKDENTLVCIKTYFQFLGYKLCQKEYLYSFSIQNRTIYNYYN
jgi:hypothetical protein